MQDESDIFPMDEQIEILQIDEPTEQTDNQVVELTALAEFDEED
jgi:hypothetical protein